MRGFLLLAGFLAACMADEPAPAWLVDEPRVMAIAADPPAVRPDGSTRLSALVTDGVEPRLSVAGSWRACAPWVQLRDPDVDCGPGQSVVLPVDEEGRASLSVPELAAAFGLEVPEVGLVPNPCAEETFASVPVVYETQVGDRRLVATKQVPVANLEGKNPEISWVSFGDAVLPDWEMLRYRPGQAYAIGVALFQDSLDLLCSRDGDRLERIRVYVYVNGGDLDDSRLDLDYELSGASDSELATWVAPPDGEPVTFWFIATERGGRPGIGLHTETIRPE
jgi:hypothetical protein